MRPRTVVAVFAVFAVLAGGVVFALGGLGAGTEFAVEWTSDTRHDVSVNHHHPATAVVDGEAFVFAPVSGRANTSECDLVALDADSGDGEWRHSVPPSACAIHAVADPALGDVDGDGTEEVLAATTERRVFGFDPTTGERVFAYELSAYGYSQPLVTDFVGGPAPEVVVVDARGEVSVVHRNGTAAWTRELDAYTFGQPAVEDFDADGEPELGVATAGNGTVYAFESDGSLDWRNADAVSTVATWQATGNVDGDDALELVVGTRSDGVVAFDGRNGSVEWRRHLADYTAVHALGDGDDDGDAEVYATAADGVLRALDGATGEVEWSTTLTTADVQMTPPPTLGDVDGDGDAELVATSNDGMVKLVNPADGSVTATYSRDVVLYTHPVLADTDGDGADEVYVMYSDGAVVALDAS